MWKGESMTVDLHLCAPDVARYVVGKCSKDNVPVSNLQLQKILYFLQYVFCIATEGFLLFDDEFFAWQYGPVIPAVYDEYKFYGSHEIDETFGDDFGIDFGEARSFVDSGIESLRVKYPWDLVSISHEEGSPWRTVWNGGAGRGKRIPNALLRESALKERSWRG